jgi:hypothetical protein
VVEEEAGEVGVRVYEEERKIKKGRAPDGGSRETRGEGKAQAAATHPTGAPCGSQCCQWYPQVDGGS